MPPTKDQKAPVDKLTDPEQLRVRINKLVARLHRETDQAECDWMEAELQALEQIRDAQGK